MIFGEKRKTLIPQMKRMVGAGSISPTGKRNSTEFQSRLLGSHVHHSQNYRNFSNVKNPWRAACGVQPTFFKPQTLSGIPTHPLLSAKIIPKAPKGQAKANRRVREGPLFPRDLCSSVWPLCPESGSLWIHLLFMGQPYLLAFPKQAQRGLAQVHTASQD